MSPALMPFTGPSVMRLELPAATTPVDHPPLPAQIVLEYTDHCIPCRRNKQEILKQLHPVGWEIGEDSDSQIRFVRSADPSETYPKITLYQRGQVREIWRGYQDPSFLSHRLRAAWDAADEPVRTAVTHASAGTFHIKSQVRQAIEFLRKHLGPGQTLSMIWDRSEARLNLLAGIDFEPRDLWGLSGRIQLDAPNAVQLPVKSFATSYQLIGNDVRFSPEPFNVIGLANKIGVHRSQTTYAAPQPAQLLLLDDSLLIYSVVQMIRDIVALLHPSADIVLPDQIVCHVLLDGDTITISFDKPPRLCLKWLFTFNLAIQRITINETKVHLDFSGSRFVKSREFDVR